MTAARLYFETPSDDPERQRLLLLTHHFPPSEAIGALRWRRFVTIFAERGWNVDVLTVAPSSHAAAARSLSELPAGTRVWGIEPPAPAALRLENALYRFYRRLRPARRGPAAQPGAGAARVTASTAVRPEVLRREEVGWQLASPRGWARLWFTLRDLSSGSAWSRRVARAAEQIADRRVHRVIITSGPPHHWHEAGRRVSEASGIPLVVDLRDPWSVADTVHEYFATPAWLRATARRERRVVEAAAVVVANTEPLREAMLARHPDAADRLITVMNGFDDEPVPTVETGSTFTIGYAGSIYYGRDPRPLFEGAARTIRELALAPADLQIRFIGDVQQYGGVPLTALAETAGIGDFVQVAGRTSREEARRFMASCQMLVSIPWDDGLTIPAKLFEYACFEAWLLVFAQPGSATARVLAGQDVDVVEPDDSAGVTAAITRRLRQFRTGQRPPALSRDPRLSRRAQAAVLLDALGRFRAAPVAPQRAIR